MDLEAEHGRNRNRVAKRRGVQPLAASEAHGDLGRASCVDGVGGKHHQNQDRRHEDQGG